MAIQDFGKKIGGAKKDLWKLRGLMKSDLLEMNEAEKDKFIKKDNVWQKPDYEALVHQEGVPVRVVYFMKLMRDSIATKPVFSSGDDEVSVEAKREGYIEFVGQFRDAVMGLRSENEVRAFYDNQISPYLIHSGYYSVSLKPEAYDCITNKTLKAANTAKNRLSSFDREIEKKQFCYTDEQKILAPYAFLPFYSSNFKFTKDYQERDMIEVKVPGGTIFLYPESKYMDPDSWKEGTVFILKNRRIHSRNYESVEIAKQTILAKAKEALGKDEIGSVDAKNQKKKKLVPKQLKHIRRVGDDYRKGKAANGSIYLKTFEFKGGEFGNWLNEKDRQASLDYGYDALYDLSRALEIDTKDISLGGRLSIAFGSRGSGSALAHYEPLREVINLTKMKGAGSLAHEWGHALDDIIGKQIGLRGFMTENKRNPSIPESLKTLVDTMLYKKVSNEETLQKQKKAAEEYKKSVKYHLDSQFPSTLSEEQKIKKEALIESYFTHASESEEYFGSYVFTAGTNPYIEALSTYKKELTGRIIPKEDRRNFNSWQNGYWNKVKVIGEEMNVQTDFYENSCLIDKYCSKTSHGYWNSTVEMFARAFSCYVKDKLEEKGIQSDYLCGHSEDAATFIPDKEGNLKLVNAIPLGEERKILNQCFDNLISDLKKRDLLHHKEYVPETSKENILTEKKTSLDSMIATIQAEQREKEKHSPLPSIKEAKNGQFEFDLGF